ncbi:MAG TPA: aconitase X catalytic domain-containing protein [Anaerovoracaceae bacterium]|nr:aconitase X catalytic domain-containing protein [Anaerovoracaceae bacterium]
MYLSDEEKRMLNGEMGYPKQKAMQILVALGESFGAEKMVDITSCHLPGASVQILGEAGVMFVREMAAKGGQFNAYTTTNPTSCDPSRWEDLAISPDCVQKQQALTGAYQSLGAITCGCCSPYFIGNAPRLGEHAAWGESSAVVYANSVLGARTNREGGPSALAAALTGKAPAYGMHLKENRCGKILVHVPRTLQGTADYGTLGYFVGTIAGQDIPVFTGIPAGVTFDELKSLGSSLATSGAVSLFHVVGVTPEAPDLETAFGGREPLKAIEYTVRDEKETEAHLNLEKSDHVDWVYIGCPQCSILEVRDITKALAGKKVHTDVEMWICASAPVKALAERMGYTEILEEAGAKLVCETCPAHAPSKEMAKIKGYRTITTDSAKMAHYAAGEVGFLTHYGSTEKVIQAAVSKRWVD